MTFCEEKCFAYRPETREKAIINYCEQAKFLCVSETCDSSQYFVGESHSLSVHRGVDPFFGFGGQKLEKCHNFRCALRANL